MPPNQIIQGLWIGKSLSPIEQLSIKSFLANGNKYHLYSYREIKNIPEGTEVKDANEIIPENKIYTYQREGWGKGGYGAFANQFRYQLLYEKGNWWFDLDMICLRPLDLTEEIIISTSYEWKWGDIANNNVLKFPKGSPFLRACIDYCNSIEYSSLTFGQTGPFLIQRMVNEFEYNSFLSPYYFFNPIGWREIQSHIYKKRTLSQRLKEMVRPLIKPKTMKGRTITKGSYAVHLWNEVWRQQGLSKEENYHPNSLIEKLKRKYINYHYSP